MKIDTKNYQKDGVNVLGYFSLEKGLGQSVRDVANCLEKNNVNWSGIDFAVGGNGNCSDDSYIDKITDLVKYETSIVHINGDQYPLLESKGPRELWKTYKVGIIYWELPEMQSLFMGLYNKVDEFWAPTKYIKDILDKTAPCPVVYMPYGIERPEIDVKNTPENIIIFRSILFCFLICSMFIVL